MAQNSHITKFILYLDRVVSFVFFCLLKQTKALPSGEYLNLVEVFSLKTNIRKP